MRLFRKFGCAALVTILSLNSASAQNSAVSGLDANIAAAAQCNGAVLATIIYNHSYDVIDEPRARKVFRSLQLAYMLNALKHQDIEHLNQYSSEYDRFSDQSYQSALDALLTQTFDWQYQGEIDLCIALLFSIFSEPPISSFGDHGVNGYLRLIENVNQNADQKFDFMLQFIEALR